MPGLDPGEPLEHDPLVERVHERDQRLERHVELELSRTGANASVSTARHSACTRASRSRSSGRFQASACSSNQIFWYGRSSSR